MPLTVYGMAQSSCTRRVLATLAEKNVTDYTLTTINLLRGEQRDPSFQSLSPFSKVPVLSDPDADVLIYESRAICQYIARKYEGRGEELMPAEGDVKARALFEQVSGRWRVGDDKVGSDRT